MSHGGGPDKVDPNLTPLLDVVLQLLMFFIMVTRFVSSEQNPETEDPQDGGRIILPVVQAASPVTRADNEIIFLNVDREGNIILNQQKMGLEPASFKLKDKVDLAKKAGKEVTLILRAHRSSYFETIFTILETCKEVGLSDVRVRAERTLSKQ